MATIDELIKKIDNISLRERIQEEINHLNKGRRFGLVFEQHLPEATPIYNTPIKKGSTVSFKGKQIEEIWTVLKTTEETATCLNRTTREIMEFSINELVVVAQFGEPIYPCLIPMDKVNNGKEDDFWHTLIESDNYHALQLLEYLYPKQVDCIYIDPPYNSGASDWKYNNNYVDKNDNWRHSKWLSFMERRLKIAKRLLNPNDSVLIVAIDDNELYTLGLLLDELFRGCERQIINMTINPKGKARDGRLSQVDEYLIVVYLGDAKAQELSNDIHPKELRWPYLRRSDVESARGTTKGGVRQFYPIYVDISTEKIVHIGNPLSPEQELNEAPDIPGTVPVFPIREDGKHMNWGLVGESLKYALDNGFVRVMKSTNPHQPYNFSYVTAPSIDKVKNGVYLVDGIRPDGTKIVVVPTGKPQRATTAWSKTLYDANAYGTQLVGEFIKDKKFPFPKSIYSVLDVLRVFIGDKKNALVVDFFAGSGTTLNAVNLLNSQDNGKRRCVIVTNNELSEEEAKKMKEEGYYPGEIEWEKNGICQSITWPRTKASILGKRLDGTILEGEYYINKFKEKTRGRTFNKISFVSSDSLSSVSNKKQLVSLMGKDKLPQSLVQRDTKYIVSPKYNTSILFDELFSDEWIDKLTDQDHIQEFYIVTEKNSVFNEIKNRITDLLGDIKILENEKKPLSEGFIANCEYFN